jgi:hypothetical protein
MGVIYILVLVPFGAAYGCGRGTAIQLQERSVGPNPKGIQFILSMVRC